MRPADAGLWAALRAPRHTAATVLYIARSSEHDQISSGPRDGKACMASQMWGPTGFSSKGQCQRERPRARSLAAASATIWQPSFDSSMPSVSDLHSETRRDRTPSAVPGNESSMLGQPAHPSARCCTIHRAVAHTAHKPHVSSKRDSELRTQDLSLFVSRAPAALGALPPLRVRRARTQPPLHSSGSCLLGETQGPPRNARHCNQLSTLLC